MKKYYQHILSILLLGLSISTAFAEGSKDFYKSNATGRRAVLVSAPEGGAILAHLLLLLTTHI